MIFSAEIKSIVTGLGADSCGIDGIDRFSTTPDEFRPIVVI